MITSALSTPIRCISFDADGTLLDFQRAMSAALERALITLKGAVGAAAGDLTVDNLVAIRDEVAALMPNSTHEAIRRHAFGVTLHRLRVNSRILADRLYDGFMADRYRFCQPFTDVGDCLSALRPRYGLGIISNGNSYPARCGLADAFDWVVLSQEAGYRKPDREIFVRAARRAGCAPRQMLHIGDDLVEDVAGALAAGLQAVWLNRTGAARPLDLPCDELQSLKQLPLMLP